MSDYLLKEDNSYLLQESGDKIILDAAAAAQPGVRSNSENRSAAPDRGTNTEIRELCVSRQSLN